MRPNARILLPLLLALLLGLGGAAPTSSQQISPEARNHALISTVQVIAVDDDYQVIGTGSGSIVDPRGVVLTNFHVVGDPESGDLANSDGIVGIAITSNPRQPAVPTFLAQVVEGDPNLDLAIVRIVSDLEGNQLDQCLTLPTLGVGDPDSVQVGDELAIIGFPGIGGNSVTLTRGIVSGFESEGGQDAAWIKTDAEINPGNSGGAAVSSDGSLVGVPSQVVVDQSTGAGQLGRIRPVNFASEWLANLASVEVPGCNGASGGPGSNGNPGGQRPQNGAPRGEGKPLTGTLVSADSGRPIANGVVIILVPGLSWNDADLENADDIYDVIRTDSRGNFESNEPIDLTTTYGLGAGAKGYRDLYIDDLDFSEFDDGSATIEIEVSLKRE